MKYRIKKNSEDRSQHSEEGQKKNSHSFCLLSPDSWILYFSLRGLCELCGEIFVRSFFDEPE
jgi:hypothetical protein